MRFFKRKEKGGIVPNRQIENGTVDIVEKVSTKIITSKDIQDDMQSKLNFILGDNNIRYMESEEESVNKFKEQNSHITEKAEKLSSLGFVNTPAVIKNKEVETVSKNKMSAIEVSKKEIELNRKYKLEFPRYKFVPDRIYREVMEKYDLYKSEPFRYIKEIPNKNLEEIVEFKNSLKPLYQLVCKAMGSSWKSMRETSYNKEELEEFLVARKNLVTGGLYYDIEEQKTIEITAPISHFNIKDSEINGRTISDKKVEDPIVTHKVDGGFIVVSVWDKEAEIPEINNENLN